jgi:hypothetical protein
MVILSTSVTFIFVRVTYLTEDKQRQSDSAVLAIGRYV